MTNNIENRLNLKKMLFLFEYARATLMNDHFNGFNKIISDLLNLEIEIYDVDKEILLFNSFLESYGHLSTTFIYRKQNVMFDFISFTILANEKRLKDKG